MEFRVRIMSQESCHQPPLPLSATPHFKSVCGLMRLFCFAGVLRPLLLVPPSLNETLRARLAQASTGEGRERVLQPLNISRRLQKVGKLVDQVTAKLLAAAEAAPR